MYLLIYIIFATIAPIVVSVSTEGYKIEEESWMDNNKSDVNTSTDVVFLDGISSIEDVCVILNISLSRCRCDILPQFCEFQTSNSTFKSIYIRNKTFTIVYTSVTMFSSLFGLLGNAAVLLVAYHHRHHLPSGKLHIAELALVNFIFCLVQIINAIPLYWTNSWIYSIAMCKVIRSAMEFASLLTIGFILIIAIERYFHISCPFQSRYTERRFRHSLVIINIIVVMSTIVPFFIGLGIDNNGRCIMFHGSTSRMFLPYNWFVVTVYSVIPVFITFMLYIKIIKLLSKQARDKQLSNSNAVFKCKMANINRRIVFITVLTLGAFIICTLPTRAIAIYMAMINYQMKNMELYLTLAFISYILYPLQSTLNPILYSTVAKEWRKEMRETIMRFGRQVLHGNTVTSFNTRVGENTETRETIL